MLAKAIEIAANVHAGQTGKGGAPAILHPLQLMMKTEGACGQICAVLHETVKNGGVTLDGLRREGFDEDVIAALDCLTRRAGESYDDFIGRVLQNKTACRVKRLDLIDSIESTCISGPCENDFELREKCFAALTRIHKAMKGAPITTNTTVAECMAAETPHAFELMQHMLERPGVYAGTNHFYYIDLLLQGYSWERGSFCLLPSRQLQYWLLHTQSAALHTCSMQGRSLFYRLFGVRALAFEHYKGFLEAVLPEEPDDPSEVSFEISSYESEHDIVRYEWEDDVPPDHNERLAKNVVSGITGMIDRAGAEHDRLRIYVRRERLFVQVRFLFRTADGWNDGAEIIAKDENHGALIAMHANARNASEEALRTCGCDVNDAIVFSNSWENCEVTDLESLITDETAFITEYLRWKEAVVREAG